jgi:TetR/AcrR family transcriptional repressor of nem operon
MSRPKEFNRTEVLERAMELFWRQGFQGTSVQDLVDHMGIGRASLYGAFGSKDGLRDESIACYVERVGSHALEALRQPASPRSVLAGFLDELLLHAERGDPRCCLMTRTVLSSGPKDEMIRRRVAALLDQIEAALVDLLERGCGAGEFRADLCRRGTARHLLNTMQGMGVSAAARTDPGILADIVTVTLALLEPPPPYSRT